MDDTTPTIALCIQGTQAEFQGKPNEAQRLYLEAWEAAQNDYEACVAAHYVARFQTDTGERLRWNLIALEKANAVGDDRVTPFYPSLYLNLGKSYELLGEADKARTYYDLATELGLPAPNGLISSRVILICP